MVYLYARGLAGPAPSSVAPPAEPRGGHRVHPLAAVDRERLVGVVATSAVIEFVRTASPASCRFASVSRATTPGSSSRLRASGWSSASSRRCRWPCGLARTMAPVGPVPDGRAARSRRRDADGRCGTGRRAHRLRLLVLLPCLTGTLRRGPGLGAGRLMSIHQMATSGTVRSRRSRPARSPRAMASPQRCSRAWFLAQIGLIAVRAAWRELDRRVDTAQAVAIEEGFAG